MNLTQREHENILGIIAKLLLGRLLCASAEMFNNKIFIQKVFLQIIFGKIFKEKNIKQYNIVLCEHRKNFYTNNASVT